MKARFWPALAAALALCLLSGVALAQDVAPVPDTEAGVRGYGAIETPDGALGQFSICVIRRAGIVSGYFRYCEITPTSASVDRRNYVYTKKIVSLDVVGNTAEVVAEGVFNGQAARLTFEGLDDNPCGDWVRITAAPYGPLPYIWSVSGGVQRGDVCIWQAPPQPAFTKGCGVIEMVRAADDGTRRCGQFKFYGSEPTPDALIASAGCLYFVEGSIRPVTSAVCPPVRVCVPRLARVSIDGFRAKMSGKGTINGDPCVVEALAIDNSAWVGPELKPDWFEISVFTADSSVPAYFAHGPVIKGDIVVFPGS